MTADSAHHFSDNRQTPDIPLSRRPATRIAFGFLVAIAYASVLAGAGFFISGAVNSMSQSNGAARATIESVPEMPRASAVLPVDPPADAPSMPQAAALAAPEPATAPVEPPHDAAPAVVAVPESPPAAVAPVEAKTASTESPPVEAVPPMSVAPQLTSAPQSSALARDFAARGDERLDQGDIASARLFYERAADEGDARAARRLGNSFDPAFLARWGARFMRADPDQAARWYRRAGTLGDAEAAQDLSALKKQ